MTAHWLLKAFELLGDSREVIQRIRKLAVRLAIAGRLESNGESNSDWDALLKAVDVRNDDGHAGNLERLPFGTTERRLTKLGSIARVEKGLTAIAHAKPGPYPLVVTAEQRASCDHYDFEGAAAIVPLVSSAGHGKASLNRLHYQEGKFALGSILVALFPNAPRLISPRFLYEYLSAFKEELLVSRMIGTANVTLTVRKIADVPVPLIEPSVQWKLAELCSLCDRVEDVKAKREEIRDLLMSASLARLDAPDPNPLVFAEHARFALATLTSHTARIDQLPRLRKSILNLAVRGKLSASEPGDDSAVRVLEQVSATKANKVKTTGDSRIRIRPDANRDQLPWKVPSNWAVQSFENLFLFIDYRGKTPPKTATGVPLITAKNIRMGHLRREPQEFISIETFRMWMTRGVPLVGDLFFTTEAPLANVCINNLSTPFALAQRVICLQPYGSVNTRFFMYALMSDPMQSLIEAHATGTTAKGIKAAKLKPLPIPVPPLAEQQRIATTVDSMMAEIDRLEATLASGHRIRIDLLQTLLSETFRTERH